MDRLEYREIRSTLICAINKTFYVTILAVEGL